MPMPLSLTANTRCGLPSLSLRRLTLTDGEPIAEKRMGAAEGLAFATTHDLAARFVSRSAEGIVETLSPAFVRHLDASA